MDAGKPYERRVFVIEVLRLINGQILGLSGLVRPAAHELIERLHSFSFDPQTSFTLIINCDGVGDPIFQGVQFITADGAARSSYFPLFTVEEVKAEIDQHIQQKTLIVFMEKSECARKFVLNEILGFVRQKTGAGARLVMLNFVQDLLAPLEQLATQRQKPLRPS